MFFDGGDVVRRRKEPQKKWKEVNARKSARWAKIGRAFEQEVLVILTEAQEGDDSLFEEVIYHKPHSEEDRDGKDFTVVRDVNGRCQTCSFGVTISHTSVQASCITHPDVQQFHFPIGTKPETIIKRVRALFDDS